MREKRYKKRSGGIWAVRRFSICSTAEMDKTTNLGLDLIPSKEGITDTVILIPTRLTCLNYFGCTV